VRWGGGGVGRRDSSINFVRAPFPRRKDLSWKRTEVRPPYFFSRVIKHAHGSGHGKCRIARPSQFPKGIKIKYNGEFKDGSISLEGDPDAEMSVNGKTERQRG